MTKPTYYESQVTVTAQPMTRLEYVVLRGWELPADENGADAGMLTVNADQPSNLAGYNGYVTWLPIDAFASTYRETYKTDRLDFGSALAALRNGGRVARDGWHGTGMYICYVPGGSYTGNDDKVYDALPYLIIKLPGGDVVPWLPSQTDLLSDDWFMAEDEDTASWLSVGGQVV